MPIAGNITLITVSGQYVDFQGNAIAGQIRFTLSEVLRNQIADQIVVPSTISATLDSNGSFSVVLPATNDPEFSQIFTYSVEEAFAGGRIYTISLPEGAPTRNIADLAPTGTFVQYYPLASSYAWGVLTNSVNAMDVKVDQANTRFIYPNPPYDIVALRSYAEVNSYATTYSDLLSSIWVVASDLDRTNLCTNPSFETDTSIWGSYYVSTLTRVLEAGAPSGNYALAVQITNTGGGNPNGTVFLPTTVVPANTQITVSAYIRGTSGRIVHFSGRANDSGNAYLSEGLGAINVTLTATWQRVSVTYTVTGQSFMPGLQFYIQPANFVGTDTFYLDGVLIEKSSAVGNYTEGDGFLTRMQTQATNAVASSTSATASLTTITTEYNSRLDELMMVGA